MIDFQSYCGTHLLCMQSSEYLTHILLYGGEPRDLLLWLPTYYNMIAFNPQKMKNTDLKLL